MGQWKSHLAYSLGELHENWREKYWWREVIGNRINSPLQQLVRPRDQAISFLDEEWDTLIVLDACRADLFNDVVNAALFDDCSTGTSPASETSEWLNYTFDGQHSDIVYVAGNPMVSSVKPESFHDLIEIWRDAWDESSGIVRPEHVTEAAIEARKTHPNKRLVVHYMQPHAPFIDYPELNFSGDAEEWGLEVSDEHPHYDDFLDLNNPWEALADGIIDVDDVWEAYEHTLHVVMEEVERLLDSTDRRVVVTSDHGNAFGERSWPVPFRTFGHPGNKRCSVLTRVPWCVVEGEQTTIEHGETNSSTNASEDEVRDRLADLGYVDE